MKRFFRSSFIFSMFFVFVGLVACSSPTSSNSFSGSKYRMAGDEKMVISFVNKTEWKFLYDGRENGGGTYKVDGKTIFLSIQGEIRVDGWVLGGTCVFKIVDKNTIEEGGTGIWKKI